MYQICSDVNVEIELPFSHLYVLKNVYITGLFTYGKFDLWSLQKDMEKTWPFLLDSVCVTILFGSQVKVIIQL